MIASPSPSPAFFNAGLFLTSHRVGVSSRAGNLLARILFCVARQLLSCVPNGLDRLDQCPAGPVILKSLHGACFESVLPACHGADPRAVRHG